METAGLLSVAQRIFFAFQSWTGRYLELVGLLMLERLIYCICFPPKKHVGGESNFLTDKSKLCEKVYVLELFHVPFFFIFVYGSCFFLLTGSIT